MTCHEQTLRQWLEQEPFMLAMSSGFFGFFAHTGMLSVLEQEGLLPTMIAGSSAGALVGSMYAAGLSTDQIRQELLRIRRSDFWDPFPGLGLLRGRLFRKRLERLLPVTEFSQCRIPLVLSTYDGLRNRTRVIEKGALAPAIHAACAVPLLFQPVWLNYRPHWDGGILDRHGIAGLPGSGRLFYHHLASRSPWRRKDSPALRPPSRGQTVSLVIKKLPRLGPFRLADASQAYDFARAATEKALDLHIRSQRVDVSAPA